MTDSIATPEPTKHCTLCGEEKPYSAFRKNPAGRFGLQPRCTECLKQVSSAYYKAHPEKWAQKEAELRAKDPEGLKKKNRDAATRWRADPANVISKRMAYIEKRYGITYLDFEAMEATQAGLCKICKRPPDGRFDRLHVDHDHKTGKVRGLLCHGCNVSLGRFQDKPEWLDAAAAYLRSFAPSP